MSPYPTSQMHAAQKRGMYPMGHHHQMPPSQNVPGAGVMYPHNQQNYVPVPQMHQNYMRPGPMNNYGRGNMMAQQQQQRPMAPQYNMQQNTTGPAVTGGVNPANNIMNAAANHQSQYGAYNHVGPNTSGMNQTGYQNVQG